jgi:hypothetical protein
MLSPSELARLTGVSTDTDLECRPTVSGLCMSTGITFEPADSLRPQRRRGIHTSDA